MNAVTKELQNALSLPERAAVALGESANDAKLRELAAKSAGIVTVTNVDGRDEAHRAGMVLRRTRTDITSTGKAAREDATAFSKAVIAMEKELIGIIEPEEVRVLALRDGFDAEEKARKDALIAAERARVEAIQADIERLRSITPRLVGKSADDLAFALKDMQSMKVEESRFSEFTDSAIKVVADVVAAIESMHADAVEREAAALAAEQARIAEAARLEAQRVENARVAAENERIANEQAAERQRLADLAAAQALAAKELADKAAANLKADRDAQELAMKIKREKAAEAQAKANAEIEAAQAELAASRAAHQAAIAKQAAIEQRNADHAAALIENAERDAARAADLARCAETAQAMLTNGRSLIAQSVEAYADAGLDEPTEGRMDDLRELVEELLAMGATADAIRAEVESALMVATA